MHDEDRSTPRLSAWGATGSEEVTARGRDEPALVDSSFDSLTEVEIFLSSPAQSLFRSVRLCLGCWPGYSCMYGVDDARVVGRP